MDKYKGFFMVLTLSFSEYSGCILMMYFSNTAYLRSSYTIRHYQQLDILYTYYKYCSLFDLSCSDNKKYKYTNLLHPFLPS